MKAVFLWSCSGLPAVRQTPSLYFPAKVSIRNPHCTFQPDCLQLCHYSRVTCRLEKLANKDMRNNCYQLLFPYSTLQGFLGIQHPRFRKEVVMTMVSFGTRLQMGKSLHSKWKVTPTSRDAQQPWLWLCWLRIKLLILLSSSATHGRDFLSRIAQIPKELLLFPVFMASQGKSKMVQSLSTKWRILCIMQLWNVPDAMLRRNALNVSSLILLFFLSCSKCKVLFFSFLLIHVHANKTNHLASSALYSGRNFG